MRKTNDAVVGFRMDRQDPFHRKVFAFCWGTLIKSLFGFKVKDLDCAFKLFRRKFFDGVELKAEGAVITVEIFSILAKHKAKIHQIGVHHYPRRAGQQTGGNPAVIARALKNCFDFTAHLNKNVSADFLKKRKSKGFLLDSPCFLSYAGQYFITSDVCGLKPTRVFEQTLSCGYLITCWMIPPPSLGEAEEFSLALPGGGCHIHNSSYDVQNLTHLSRNTLK